MKNVYLSGILLGLAIHLKLNAIIYAPTFFYFIDCVLKRESVAKISKAMVKKNKGNQKNSKNKN